jgi:HlyD family secretion protein
MKTDVTFLKRIGLAVLVLGIAGAFILALMPRPIAVDTALVSQGPLRVTVDEEGKSRIRDVFVVSAPLSGKFLRSPLHVGDYVEKGQTVVAVVEPMAPPLLDVRSQKERLAAVKAAQATVDLARAELRQAQSALEFAEADYGRTQELRQSRVAAKRTLEQTKMAYETAEAQVARAEAGLRLRQRELERAEASLTDPTENLNPTTGVTACCYEVRSPESGRVLKLVAESEQPLISGTPLVEIGDPAELEIVVELLSSDAVRIKSGALATIEDWGGPPLEAKVQRIEPSGFTKVSALGIEEQRVKVILDLLGDSKPRSRLGHEFRVYTRINVYETADALTVSLGALFRKNGAWHVFTVEDQRAKLRQIEIGERNLKVAEVESGLSKGETVILYPSDRISDDVRVTQRQSIQADP